MADDPIPAARYWTGTDYWERDGNKVGWIIRLANDAWEAWIQRDDIMTLHGIQMSEEVARETVEYYAGQTATQAQEKELAEIFRKEASGR